MTKGYQPPAMSNLTVGINRTHLICFVERKCLRQSRRYEQCSHPLPLNGSRANQLERHQQSI